MIAWYRRGVGAIDAELDAIPSAPSGAQGWHPVGARPLAWIQDQWLFELSLHDWDIRVALDPDAEVRPSVQSAFARTLPDRLGRGFGGADDPALAGTYRVELSGEQPFAFTVAGRQRRRRHPPGRRRRPRTPRSAPIRPPSAW